MRTCASCGRQNPDEQDFCACGEYLRWEPTSMLPAVHASGPPAADAASPVEESAPPPPQGGPPAAAPPPVAPPPDRPAP
ncbi:MAG TPA: hypothetical protein VII98_07320, partial [Solirubrobacteraceae bacterium]